MIKAPYNPIDVANYIVAEAIKRKKPVTHLKLQKLLYYVAAKNVAISAPTALPQTASPPTTQN